jgi:uptake hydrogenase large subunit
MSQLAGELTIDLTTRDGVVSAVEIVSTRPKLADRLLAGKPAEAAVALVPQLFSICGRAQGIAAELALQAARGAPADDPTAELMRTHRIESEIAQEYLWRALLDWPQAVGAPTDAAALADLRRAFAADPAGTQAATRDVLRAVVEQGVLGGSAQAWFEHEHVPAFEIWIAQARTAAARLLGAVQREGARHGAPAVPADVPLLPAFTDAAVLHPVAAALAADHHYAREPLFDARPAETGAIGRVQDHPLVAALSAAFGRSTLTRLAARLTELARIAAGIAPSAPLCGRLTIEGAPNRGAGWVETARGVLLHLIDLDADGERVAAYRILAPTEWNFHPRGALLTGLVGAHVTGAAELRQRAGWLVQALDPCVAYNLRIDGQAVGSPHA